MSVEAAIEAFAAALHRETLGDYLVSVTLDARTFDRLVEKVGARAVVRATTGTRTFEAFVLTTTSGAVTVHRGDAKPGTRYLGVTRP